jgi:hypothetical protein
MMIIENAGRSPRIGNISMPRSFGSAFCERTIYLPYFVASGRVPASACEGVPEANSRPDGRASMLDPKAIELVDINCRLPARRRKSSIIAPPHPGAMIS